MELKQKFIVALCGASGGIYGLRLLRALVARPVEVFFMVSAAGRKVLAHEIGPLEGPVDRMLKSSGAVFHEQAELCGIDPADAFAPIASGSFRHDGMVIAPCSMNTLAAVASGITNNLIHRAADVCLKERRPLILVPRETPFSLIHLKNMCRLAEAGAIVLPACPGFYNRPQTIEELVDTVVGRVMDHLGLEHGLSIPWKGGGE